MAAANFIYLFASADDVMPSSMRGCLPDDDAANGAPPSTMVRPVRLPGRRRALPSGAP